MTAWDDLLAVAATSWNREARQRAQAAAECTCYAPDDAEPEDHDTDCPEHPTGEETDPR